MAMTIKRTPELWGEDAENFNIEAEKNGLIPTPRLTDAQRTKLHKMLNSASEINFPPIQK